jgi:ATP-dependent Lon protease
LDLVYNAVNLAELSIEKGAKTFLIPVNARKQLNDLSDEMIAKINIQYYTDLKDCLQLKALVE